MKPSFHHGGEICQFEMEDVKLPHQLPHQSYTQTCKAIKTAIEIDTNYILSLRNNDTGNHESTPNTITTLSPIQPLINPSLQLPMLILQLLHLPQTRGVLRRTIDMKNCFLAVLYVVHRV